MGAGKSRLGSRIAGFMDMKFIDLDSEIKKDQELTIDQIFHEKGEKGFREIEKRILHQHINSDQFVLACGGGTPCYEDNMEVMNKSGTTIFLDVPQEVLFSRLSNSKQKRPLIENKNEEELRKYIDQKLAGRKKYYNKAKIKIDPLNTSLELIKQILTG